MKLNGNRGRPAAGWQALREIQSVFEGEKSKERLLVAIRAAQLNFWPLVKPE